MKSIEFEELTASGSVVGTPVMGLTKELLNDLSVVLIVNAVQI